MITEDAAGAYQENLRLLRHDINNQLSNIRLCVEQLKFEVADQTDDYKFYLDTIAVSVQKIGDLLQP